MTTGNTPASSTAGAGNATDAENTTATVKTKAEEMVGQAREKAAPVIEDVQAKAGEMAGQAQQKAKERLAEGKEKAATTLGSVAEALRETGEHLEEKDGAYTGEIGNYARQASDKISELTSYLQNTDVDDLLRETENFARRDPALFLGAAFTIGVLAARFLKSGTGRRYRDSDNYNSSSGLNEGTYNSSHESTRALPAADRHTGGVDDTLAGASINAPRNTATVPSNPAASTPPRSTPTLADTSSSSSGSTNSGSTSSGSTSSGSAGSGSAGTTSTGTSTSGMSTSGGNKPGGSASSGLTGGAGDSATKTDNVGA